jgi:hypothetical protein
MATGPGKNINPEILGRYAGIPDFELFKKELFSVGFEAYIKKIMKSCPTGRN